ncbi:hypothetical protein PhCBS80983_g04323 [Powellomyces hirtus]|uniref:HAMP domain-containing protein n=1 Tax=Powellomyces hirtus TaxID=109895 RepID=A0A507DZ35_9FUNG|nr:hypothetical protein PhCBS80983_g04323 [Powellomyces hirtus]
MTNSHDAESGTNSEAGTGNGLIKKRGSQVSAAVAQIRRFRVPLAVLLLAVTVLVAASITVPVAILSLNGATKTVQQILDVLRSNYIQQVHDKVSAQTEVAYELAQSNAEEYVIRTTLDALPADTVPFDFNTQSRLQYAYSRSVARNDFLVYAGFVRANDYDFILMAKPDHGSIMCHYNATAHYSQTCRYFWITDTFPNCTVNGYYTPSNAYPPYWIPGATTGVWDRHAYFTFNDATQTWLGAYSFYWNQWRGLPIGQFDSGSAALGMQMVTVAFDTFSALLSTITTTPNSAIAIWLTSQGTLVATNKNISVFDPASVDAEKHHGYTVLNVPQRYIASSAKSLADNNQDRFGFNVTIMIIIPELDLLATVISTRKNVLTTSLAVAAGMLAFAAATSIIVTRPVAQLTKVMMQATNMDFSALQGGYLDQQSSIRELASMQVVFSTMMKRFASAIQTNRSLVDPKASHRSRSAAPVVKQTAVLK